jgi:hypothetical protein
MRQVIDITKIYSNVGSIVFEAGEGPPREQNVIKASAPGGLEARALGPELHWSLSFALWFQRGPRRLTCRSLKFLHSPRRWAQTAHYI